MWMVWTFIFVSSLIWLIEGNCFPILARSPNHEHSCILADNRGQCKNMNLVEDQKVRAPCMIGGRRLNFRQINIDYDECLFCQCLSRGNLRCCEIGYRAGLYGVSSQCKVLQLPRCGFQIVRRDDETQPC